MPFFNRFYTQFILDGLRATKVIIVAAHAATIVTAVDGVNGAASYFLRLYCRLAFYIYIYTCASPLLLSFSHSPWVLNLSLFFFSLLDLLAVVLCAVNVKCSFEGVKKAMHRDKLIVFEIKYNVRDNESRESARTALVPNLSIERGSRPCACVHLSENKRAE